ncbi:hypothetical protein F4802DRAFT_85534 [Xylaria palmicola]|nr:hypothetical protein F4802DRAFT_85534 [Xylaria palmicola]
MDDHLARHMEDDDLLHSRHQPVTRAEIRNNAIASAEPWVDDTPIDLDTCRICRGEATDDEPLFFPCKCSGSIKYVHQDCLMEWLSHSQKKHCELCKTAFRFTKLYSPDMPKHLPFHIFIHHMTKYMFRNILVWLRAALVTSVWLGWLPYLMRSIWSFLFWISDEGFGGTALLLDSRDISQLPGTNMASMAMQGATTCPSTPLLATVTSATCLGGALAQTTMNVATKPFNISTTQTWLRMLFGLPAPHQVSNHEWLNNVSVALLHKTKAIVPDPPRSLLSDVGFLNRITKNPGVNRIIIHVLEGQIITLLAIICFILVILVRDYVVQQQPEINMRAAFAAAEDAENDMAPAAPAVPHVDVPLQDSDAETNDEEAEEDVDQNIDDHLATDTHDEHRGLRPTEPLPDIVRPNLRQRPIVGMGRRPILNIPDQIQTSRGSSPVSDRSPRGFLEEGQPGFLREPSPLRLDKDASPGRTTIGEYVRIYRAADGDNERIREIIRQEGLDEARFSRFLHKRSSSPSSSMITEKASSDSSSWTWAGSDDGNDVASTTALNKGKGRAESISDEQDREPSSSSTLPHSISRPRAISDGPQPREMINPLANNSWSFSNLQSDTASQTQDPDADKLRFDSSEMEHSLTNNSIYESVNSIASNASISTSPHAESSVPVPAPAELGVTVNMTNSNRDSSEDTSRPDDLEGEAGEGTRVPVPNADGRRVVLPLRGEQPNTIVDRVADFMWGDVPPADADGANQDAVDIFGDNQNPPFLHGGHRQVNDDEDDEDPMAQDFVEAAVAAGIDPEAVEDPEDFDGIMELIGMRGPIAGLFQNAIFCAFLVSISIFLGVVIPYNIGRVAACFLANPTLIFKVTFSCAKFIQDAALLAVGYTLTFIFNILEALRLLLEVDYGKQALRILRLDASQITTGAFHRIASGVASQTPFLLSTEMRPFSALSHHALLELKGNIHYCIMAVGSVVSYIFSGHYLVSWTGAAELWTTASSGLVAGLRDFLRDGLLFPRSWVMVLDSPAAAPSFDMALAYWGAQDRSWAIFLGYASLTLLAALYLGRGTMFSTGEAAQEWEASMIDALNQASGVMKVILIISIEMLVFPLYCGLLLDFALLPLFENTTLKSRLLFAYNYPFTSIFVHWFIGTGYMFHFALFVSMCRKIMRRGVLYFIRDPDDPEFHPVRDVLERNVSTQLRKILFSAFVYGALVVICLGGVVWGLSITLPNVLPIHYTYNEPVLEFPVDLLFCNFLMPLAVKFFKPSDGLHTMYTWWFRKCANALRLTWFLFGERRIEEEGKLVADDDAYGYRLTSWHSMFLGVNVENKVARKGWKEFFSDGDSKPASKISSEEMLTMIGHKKMLVESGKLIPDGRFVRSPASDQAKITKGHAVFLHVSEHEMAQYYETDRSDPDPQSGNQFQIVYIPPWFRTRVSIFIMSIWVFAAVTGVGSTIVPLVFGRRIFTALVPQHIRTNDIYAFSIGVYVLSSASYLVFHLHTAFDTIRDWTTTTVDSMLDRHALERATQLAYRGLKLTYAYSMLLIVFPIFITALVEMYVLIPLHTYMGTGGALRLNGNEDGHTVRIIQAWTLGILYLKLGSRALTLYGGRPSHAVRAVLRQGWLHPDISVLTRAFVIPGFVASMVLLLMPPILAWATLNWAVDNSTAISYEAQVSTYRLAYPITALFWAALFMLRRLLCIFQGWQVRIRDEAYLMGERLHNFTGTAAKSTGWRGSTRM